MTNIAMTAKTVFVITFMVLWVSLFRDQKYISLAIFLAAFLFGLFVQGRKAFWKICLAFFGLLSVIYSFKIFGGLEPNNQGVLSSGNWFGLEFLLFLMLVFSALMSFVAGFVASRLCKSKF